MVDRYNVTSPVRPHDILSHGSLFPHQTGDDVSSCYEPEVEKWRTFEWGQNTNLSTRDLFSLSTVERVGHFVTTLVSTILLNLSLLQFVSDSFVMSSYGYSFRQKSIVLEVDPL